MELAVSFRYLNSPRPAAKATGQTFAPPAAVLVKDQQLANLFPVLADGDAGLHKKTADLEGRLLPSVALADSILIAISRLQTDDRFAVGIFIRGKVPWDEEDPEMNNNVVVCSFMPRASAPMSTYRLCANGHKLHCSDGRFQLYNKHLADSFVYITRPPAASDAEIVISVALQKISANVQRVGSFL